MQFYETSALNGQNIDKAIRDIASIASEMDTVPLSPYIITSNINSNQP